MEAMGYVRKKTRMMASEVDVLTVKEFRNNHKTAIV